MSNISELQPGLLRRKVSELGKKLNIEVDAQELSDLDNKMLETRMIQMLMYSFFESIRRANTATQLEYTFQGLGQVGDSKEVKLSGVTADDSGELIVSHSLVVDAAHVSEVQRILTTTQSPLKLTERVSSIRAIGPVGEKTPAKDIAISVVI